MIQLKKKILSMLTILCILASTALQTFAVSGKGTEANPFRISTAGELLLLEDFPECYFELENDIEYTGAWVPVTNFSGSLDGKGHTITIADYSSKTNMGFFGTLSGTVQNLTINANDISEERSAETYIGLFAGKCTGTIKNCNATGKMIYKAYYTTSHYFGGFCGA